MPNMYFLCENYNFINIYFLTYNRELVIWPTKITMDRSMGQEQRVRNKPDPRPLYML